MNISDGNDHLSEYRNEIERVLSPVINLAIVFRIPPEPNIPIFQMNMVAKLGKTLGKNKSIRAAMLTRFLRIMERKNAKISGGTMESTISATKNISITLNEAKVAASVNI